MQDGRLNIPIQRQLLEGQFLRPNCAIYKRKTLNIRLWFGMKRYKKINKHGAKI